MIVVTPKRHIITFEEMTKEERVHLFEIVDNVIAILRDNKIADYF